MNVAAFLALIVFLASTHARHNKLVEKMSIVSLNRPVNDDFGVATNCGESAISAIWTPKIISSQGQVTAYVNFTAPYDMDGGYGEVDIYRHADGSIIAQFGTPFTCNDVKQWITCPLAKNQYISVHDTVADLSALIDYADTFDVVLKISNNQDQQMLCLNATITVTR